GDIHGEFNNLTNLLLKAGLVDSELNWTGHKRHIVALGDIFDRGHDVTRTLWFLFKLEKQAAQTGGMVHVVLGNHEIMTFGNDLRYLSGKEKLIATTHHVNYAEMYSPRHSLLGQWLAQKPALLKIDSALFAHGGVTPPYTALSIQAINDSVKAFLQEDVFYSLLQGSVPAGVDSSKFYNRLAFFYADDSIFWHRGYVRSDTLKNDLKKVLKAFKAKVQVVAHTPVQSIRTFYDGKVIAVDLNKPVTEMLLLVRDGKNKFKKFKVTAVGVVEPI
ncbi:MAG: metallophosphoesterase, partial [bacterium]